jgi:hypothetical protein
MPRTVEMSSGGGRAVRGDSKSCRLLADFGVGLQFDSWIGLIASQRSTASLKTAMHRPMRPNDP